MIRHIFIATIKDGMSDEMVNRKIEEMKAMKERIPQIKSINVGRSLGIAGPTNTVTMVIDTLSKEDFLAILGSDAHKEVASRAGEVFRTDNFILSQIEISCK